jgi:DNA modification methylase
MKLLLGDCSEKLKILKDNSVDSIVTDPPYGLSFMGKKWDYDVPSVDIWKECLRVLKPGGYLLSFAGTRTQHRMAVNIEDAGFEIRDMIMYVYGSGFPKSLNIGKAVDKLQGNERKVTGKKDYAPGWHKEHTQNDDSWTGGEDKGLNITKGTSEWEGWGTALKPAVESITVALKPLNTVPYYDIIEQEVKELLCQLQQLAKTVVESSKSSQVDTKGESDIAQWSVEEYISTQEGLSVLMGMLQLESERTLSLNIVLSWLSILGEALKLESKSTIEMKISLITELRTLNSLEWGNISQSIIQAKDSQINIQNANVLTVVGLFIGLEKKLRIIQEPFVVENAILREREKTFVPNLSPIIMSRKPLEKGLNVAQNCLRWGVGGINIDGCRVGFNNKDDIETYDNNRRGMTERSKLNEGDRITEDKTYDGGWKKQNKTPKLPQGRFPANLIHDGSEEVVGLFPNSKSTQGKNVARKDTENIAMSGRNYARFNEVEGYTDSGSAARFFYCSKASKRERNIGCEGLEEKEQPHSTSMKCAVCGLPILSGTGNSCKCKEKVEIRNKVKNFHPTVKPLSLMEYLVKLVSREGQVVLDPFMGSGTTGMACKKLNRDFIGIEMMPEYMEIAKCRIEGVKKREQLNML